MPMLSDFVVKNASNIGSTFSELMPVPVSSMDIARPTELLGADLIVSTRARSERGCHSGKSRVPSYASEFTSSLPQFAFSILQVGNVPPYRINSFLVRHRFPCNPAIRAVLVTIPTFKSGRCSPCGEVVNLCARFFQVFRVQQPLRIFAQ